MRDTKIHVPLSRRHAVLGTWQGAGPKRALDVSADVVATFNGQTIRLAHEMIWAPHDRFAFMTPEAKIERGPAALLREMARYDPVSTGEDAAW